MRHLRMENKLKRLRATFLPYVVEFLGILNKHHFCLALDFLLQGLVTLF